MGLPCEARVRIELCLLETVTGHLPVPSSQFQFQVAIPPGALQFKLYGDTLQHCSAELCQYPTNAAPQNLTPQTLNLEPSGAIPRPCLEPYTHEAPILLQFPRPLRRRVNCVPEYLQQDNLRKFFNSNPQEHYTFGSMNAHSLQVKKAVQLATFNLQILSPSQQRLIWHPI